MKQASIRPILAVIPLLLVLAACNSGSVIESLGDLEADSKSDARSRTDETITRDQALCQTMDCDDGLPCTTEKCTNGECVAVLLPFYCLIEATCVPSGAANPENPCEVCVHSSAPEAWSVRPDGEHCGAGRVCYGGECCERAANCAGLVCGDDGCGGTCGECESGFECVDGLCLCQPDCADSTCGPDGCGGSCGECGAGYLCVYETGGLNCAPSCFELCLGRQCGSAGQVGECSCGECEDDANPCTDTACTEDGSCIHLPNDFPCDDGNPCTAEDTCSVSVCAGQLLPLNELTLEECLCEDDQDCALLDDGDSCNGIFVCDTGVNPSACVTDPASVPVCFDDNPCTSDSCDPDVGCLFTPDDAGDCGDGATCEDGKCVCSPDCSGKECGDDGCGGSCGECAGPQHYCFDGQCVCIPNCAGKNCGDDGCGNSCGKCCDGQNCLAGTCTWLEQECNDGNCVDWDGCTEGKITEFQVNQDNPTTQSNIKFVPTGPGQYVAVWDSDNQDGDLDAVVAQAFDDSFGKTGGELVVNTTFFGNQHESDVASIENELVLVVWDSWSGGWGLENADVMGRFLLPNGVPDGAEFDLTDGAAGVQFLPQVTALPGSGFYVVWQDSVLDEDGLGIGAQRLDTTGAKIGEPVVVNASVAGDQERPKIAALSDGRIVVAWLQPEDELLGDGAGVIRARLFDASLNPLSGPEVTAGPIQTDTVVDDFTLVPLDNGECLIAWDKDVADAQNGTVGENLVGQVYDSNGSKSGALLDLGGSPANFMRARGTVLKEGLLVMVWYGNGADDTAGIWVRHFDLEGGTGSAAFRANSYIPNWQSEPSIISLEDDIYLVSWSSVHQTGFQTDCFGQRFAADGTKLYH